MPSRMWRRAAWVGGGALAVALVLFLLRMPILTGLARFLVVSDEPQPADAIVVLNGGLQTRPAAAAALYRRGLAPIVAIVREEESIATEYGLVPNTTDVAIGLLRRLGVPGPAVRHIRMARGATSTREEARAFASYARGHGFRRIIVVTHDYHSRRSRSIFRRALRGMGIEVLSSPAPHHRFDASNWWHSEIGLVAIVNEYLKFAYFLVES